MIKHIVCFKLKAGESKEKVAEVLLSMEGNVPMMKGIEVGVDALGAARSYDVFLSVLLEDMDALAAYQADPYHCDVVKAHMHRVTESSVSVDYPC
ncbi:MAG: Dabb family protein [Clostridia bacterium]|nr:Dabb family protein [Clostridia bacterium]